MNTPGSIMTAAQHIEFVMAKDGKPLFGPIYPQNIFDLMAWCESYEKTTPYPSDLQRRFLIGLYQIHQGMAWKDHGVNKYEGYAAGALHFIMVSVRLKLPIEDDLQIELKDIQYADLTDHMCRVILFNVSAAAQQLCYADSANKSNRKTRYNPDKLKEHLTWVIGNLIRIIPVSSREEAFYAASSIMTRELK